MCCSLRRELRPLFLSGTMCFGLWFSSFCLAQNLFCLKMRHCRTALLLLKASLDLILVFLSILPHLFSGLCLMSEHLPLCPVHPLHNHIRILSGWLAGKEEWNKLWQLTCSEKAGLGLVFQVSGSSWKHHIMMCAIVISRPSSVLVNARIISQ